jgi:dissimilatory sulfite reductase (desulfoviridin) alpha/beta subunit
MISIYQFQLQKLRQLFSKSAATEMSGLLGGVNQGGKKIIKGAYLGHDEMPVRDIFDLMLKKGQLPVGYVVCHQEAIAPSLIKIREICSDESLSYVTVSWAGNQPEVKAYTIVGDELKEEEVVVDATDFMALKKNGMLTQADDGYYSMRIKIVGGDVTVEQWENLATLARKYGIGKVHITSRQGVEIPFVHVCDLAAFLTELQALGLELGATGPRVRAVLACQGEFICTNGLINAPSIAKLISDQFFSNELPHKFKIAVTGCPSNCIKADDNDLGIKGVARVLWSAEECTYCGSCTKSCPRKAISVSTENRIFALDEGSCIHCGKCAQVCPFGSIKAEHGFRLTFGGTFGRDIVIGKPLYPFIQSEEQLLNIIAQTLAFFRQHGLPKERITKTIDRVGWDVFEQFLQQAVS